MYILFMLVPVAVLSETKVLITWLLKSQVRILFS